MLSRGCEVGNREIKVGMGNRIPLSWIPHPVFITPESTAQTHFARLSNDGDQGSTWMLRLRAANAVCCNTRIRFL
jgi:hypothetical protein